ncbi:MAG: choice-of-anchor J domain-containing protein, partial [Clostridia bacterium]|nr:choice-of-anchor J domain-containing protein [Clostridia bacterium]
SNNDGTHTLFCSRCDATHAEACEFETAVGDGVKKDFCAKCGYAVYSEVSGENVLVGWGFEEVPEGWMSIDADGDGYGWRWVETSSAYEGTHVLCSDSYINGAREPDNWAISPAFSLKGCKEVTLSLWASGYSSSYYEETFALYASTSLDSLEDFVQISDDITTDYGYINYTADLSAFVGEPEVYIAIRHYKTYDMWSLLVDLVEIHYKAADICEEHDLTFVPAVAPTATEDGNIDYYYCEECGRYYLDEDATQPVLYEDVIIPALGENAPQFTSHRLVLTGEVGVQFKVTLPEGFDETGSSVSFAVSDGRTSTVDIADATPVEGENAYWFTCFINALELADTIKATFNYGTDGEVIDTYSAMDYITTIMETYDEWSQSFCLVRDLRNYGHYLQLSGWTDGKDHEEIPAYEGSVLSEVDLEYTRNALPAENYEVVKNIEGTGIEDVKFALTLNSQQVINFFVKLAEGEEIVSYEGCTPKGTQIIGGYTYYKFNTEEINVIDITKDYTVKIETGSGTAEITASALTYIATVIKEGSTFPAEKQYAMVAYYYYISYARYVLNSQN